jgi:DNA (cytosine-5)-methyltransferase 1
MRIADLFCCQGGAATGYHRAFPDAEIVGLDRDPQPLYPFTFRQGDVLDLIADDLAGFDFIHASPPCQGYTTMSNRHGSDSPLLLEQVRQLLIESGRPYVIENVCGARRHMRSPLMLHGGMFGLPLYRPRLFESNQMILAPTPASPPKDAAAIYGRREDRRLLWTRADGSELRAASLEQARTAMEMPWADWTGVREAIPPAYTEWIGLQLASVAVTQ